MLVLVIVTEGRSLPFDPFDNQAMPEVPPAQASTDEIPTPQLHLPALTAKENRAYQLASTDGFPDMVNGRASTNPAVVLILVKHMANFPDAATVRELQEYGVRTVILHLGLTEGTPQAGAARKSIDGLPLTACRLPRADRLRGGLVERQPGAERTAPARRRGLRLRLSPALAQPERGQRQRARAATPAAISQRTDVLPRLSGLISYLASVGADGRDTRPAEHGGDRQPVVGEQRGGRRANGEDDRDRDRGEERARARARRWSRRRR